MSNVIEFKRLTANDQAEPFAWLVHTLGKRTLTVMACSPFEAMERAAEGIDGPVTFTGAYPVDDAVSWLGTWDVPPLDWTAAT